MATETGVKPVHPHYSPARRSLDRAIKRVTEEIETEERSWEYHRNALHNGRVRVEELGEELRAMQSALAALNALDKSGIIMKDAASG